MEFEGYSRLTCNRLCASGHDALDRRKYNPQARPSTSFADHTIDLPWKNFPSPECGVKFQMDLWMYPNFLITHGKTRSIRLVVSIQYRLVTDGQTDTRRRHNTTRVKNEQYGK